MLKGIDVSQRVEFSSAEDKDEPKTIFVLKPLNALELMEIVSLIDTTGKSLSAEYIAALLGKSLVEIKNPDLKDVGEIADFIMSLSFTILMELVTETNTINKLSDVEVKN